MQSERNEQCEIAEAFTKTAPTVNDQPSLHSEIE